MIRYFKERNEFIKWQCNHKLDYFIWEITETCEKTKIEYYSRRFNFWVAQYTMNNKFIKKGHFIEFLKELNCDIEQFYDTFNRQFGINYGFKWEKLKEGDVSNG